MLPVSYTHLDVYKRQMKELYRVGNNLNQVAQKAHVLNVIDVQRYDKAVRQFEKLVQDITRAVILPRSAK